MCRRNKSYHIPPPICSYYRLSTITLTFDRPSKRLQVSPPLSPMLCNPQDYILFSVSDNDDLHECSQPSQSRSCVTYLPLTMKAISYFTLSPLMSEARKQVKNIIVSRYSSLCDTTPEEGRRSKALSETPMRSSQVGAAVSLKKWMAKRAMEWLSECHKSHVHLPRYTAKQEGRRTQHCVAASNSSQRKRNGATRT